MTVDKNKVNPQLEGNPIVSDDKVSRPASKLENTLRAQDFRSLQELACGDRPYLHLPDWFRPGKLPASPESFLPVPLCDGTIAARNAATAALIKAGLHVVAYRAENEGGRFVNLVAQPGEGRLAEKSFKAMRGHTDAVSFPFPFSVDPVNPRIAPAPDVVVLAGLRNPNQVPTRIMPLDKILECLNPLHIAMLRQPHYIIGCQNTFRAGTIRELGPGHAPRGHVLHGASVLSRIGGRDIVRFSHSNIGPDEDTDDPSVPLAREALNAFCEAARACAIEVVCNPGDLLLINNRVALHGRSEVGDEIGGESRWLLRCYGMNAAHLREYHYADETRELLLP